MHVVLALYNTSGLTGEGAYYVTGAPGGSVGATLCRTGRLTWVGDTRWVLQSLIGVPGPAFSSVDFGQGRG